MVQNMLYIGKTYVKHCFVMKHHFRAPKSIRVVPSESENHFLLKETIKTRSHMIKIVVYIGFYRKISIFRFFEFLSKKMILFGVSRMMTGPIRVEKAIREAFL